MVLQLGSVAKKHQCWQPKVFKNSGQPLMRTRFFLLLGRDSGGHSLVAGYVCKTSMSDLKMWDKPVCITSHSFC